RWRSRKGRRSSAWARPSSGRGPGDGRQRRAPRIGRSGRPLAPPDGRTARRRPVRGRRSYERLLTIQNKQVGVLGAGNMGEAMIKGRVGAGLVPAAAIAATDVRADRLDQIARQYGIRTMPDNRSLIAAADVVILAVKPQIMGPVLREIAPAVTPAKLL